MSSTGSTTESSVSSTSRTQGFVTKRPHKKSRAGCQECKRRKIKCDEDRPHCSFCKIHNLKCIYALPVPASKPFVTSSRSQALAVSPSDTQKTFWISKSPSSQLSSLTSLSSSDLALLHHFSTITANTMYGQHRPGVERVVHYEVPRLAFEHDFMMHCVLGIASLHLTRLVPDATEYQSLTIAHRFKALSGLRDAISNPSASKYRAILTTSLFMLILAADRSNTDNGDDLWIASWFGLWAGMREMIRMISWEYLEGAGLSPLFARDDKPQSVLTNLPTFLTQMLASLDPEDENSITISNTIKCLGGLYDSLLFAEFGAEFHTKIIAWPANIDIGNFATLTRKMHPLALVIAAHYLVFTRLLSKVWWMAAVSEREIEAIATALPTEYLPLMEIPLLAAQLHDTGAIAMLLLSQIPIDSIYAIDVADAQEAFCK